MKFRAAVVTVACAVFLAACMASLEKYDREKCAKLPSDAVVKAIHDNCIKCHTKDFTTKEDICVRRGMIIDAVSTGRMPKMGKLYPHYRDTIVNWK